MAPMTPVVKGRTAIQAAFAGMMKDPNFALSFSPTRVVVAKSGELAYDYGNFQLTVSEKKGKANTLKAMYVVVWGKQADGSWKALADVPTSSSE